MEKSENNRKNAFVLWFEELSNNDVGLVGGKNASLGEMYSQLKNDAVPIPNGFAITAHSYFEFLKFNEIEKKMKEAMIGLDTLDLNNLQQRGAAIRGLILTGNMPPMVEKAIREAYDRLNKEIGLGRDVDVAVRSSATAEDLPDASFAGQQETFLNVRGHESLIDSCRRCFASLFTDRAISYRQTKKFDHFAIGLSIGVQLMVRSDKACSGVMFSIDPESGHPDVVVINASWGLGENIVQGAVNPDEFIVHKPTLAKGFRSVIRKTLGTKEMTMIYSKKPGQPVRNVTTSEGKRRQLCLSDDEVLQLAKWGAAIERHYSEKKGSACPMDMEFAKDGLTGKLYIVQARPETVHSNRDMLKLQTYTLNSKGIELNVLCAGASVGNRIANGIAQVIEDVTMIKDFKDGGVLVTEMTDPDWEPILRRASAIVTNRGGRTCHAAIIARELGIPCVVGCGDATMKLTSGQAVTVDTACGDRGVVYDSIVPFDVVEQNLDSLPKTNTKVTMLVGNPELALQHSMLPNAGVGLCRMEFVISNYVRAHPQALLHRDELNEIDRAAIDELICGFADGAEFFKQTLARGIATICAAFYPKPVILRFSDFKTDEYSSLLGGKQFEPTEANPMIGWRGASRYYGTERARESFALECMAVRRVVEQLGMTNLQVMIPFTRTVDELQKVLAEMKRNGLDKSNIKIIMMCEIPSNALLADEFLQHVDGFSIGSNDLTQLTLAIDRNSGDVAHLFDERHPAVLMLMRMAINACKQRGVYSGICGQGPSDHPDLCQQLIEAGIESISVQPDRIIQTTLLVAEIEEKLKQQQQQQQQ